MYVLHWRVRHDWHSEYLCREYSNDNDHMYRPLASMYFTMEAFLEAERPFSLDTPGMLNVGDF